MSCYEARAMGAEAPRLAPIEDGLAEQQRRLSDSLNHRRRRLSSFYVAVGQK